MQNKLSEKVMNEFKEKLNDIDAENIAIYMMISTYVANENLKTPYVTYLLKKSNTLDYLYEAYLDMKAKQNHYEFIKACLNNDQTLFLDGQANSDY